MMKAWRILKRLHQDQRGAEGLEKLLIIAAIVLPLLGVLLLFRQSISDWASELWNQIKGDAQPNPPDVD